MNNQPKLKEYIVGIDGLRALSILLVIFFHCNLFHSGSEMFPFIGRLFESFDIGVDCFFVISGFLITGILVDTKGHHSYYKNFFFRRLLRIFPIYYLLLFMAFIVLPQFDHPRIEKWSLIEPSWYWLFLSNIYIAFKQKVSHGMVDISWSLSIEEQFYLLWPWFIKFIQPKKIWKWCVLGLALSLVSRVYFSQMQGAHTLVHFLTICRLDGLLMGALIALHYRELINLGWMRKKKYLLMIISFCIFIGNVAYPALLRSSLWLSLSYLAISLFFSMLLWHVLDLNKESSFRKIWENKAFCSIGKYSYGIYLFHNCWQSLFRQYIFEKTNFLTQEVNLFFQQFLFVLLVLIMSYLSAWISFHAFETYFIKLKKHFSYS